MSWMIFSFVLSCTIFADALIVTDKPTVIQNAEIREAIRQDSTWTAENIQKNPYLFVQDQIIACDKLRAKIEAQGITLIRAEKQASRAIEEAESATKRYERFLADAKSAYKAANGKWPVSVNGYNLSEDELNDKIADALDRVELAKKDKYDNEIVLKKVSLRKGVLKNKKREVASLRLKLGQQAEQIKMNAALAEIGELKSCLDVIHDMVLELDEDPTKMSIEEISAEDPNAAQKRRVSGFLNK